MMRKNKIIFALMFGVCGLCFAQDAGPGDDIQITPDTAGEQSPAPSYMTEYQEDIAAEPAGDEDIEAVVNEDIETAENEDIEAAENEDIVPVYMAGGDSVTGEERQPEPAADPASIQGKPKIAVYVTGGKDIAENKALSTYILEALVRSQRYVAIERSEAFLAEIDNEQFAQRSGAIDDAQISRLGKQSGVQFVCVADITQALRAAQVSARVLDVETAEVSAVGTAESPLKTMDDLKRVSTEVVCVMLGIMRKRERRVRFGARLAYTIPGVSNYTALVQGFDEAEARSWSEERRSRVGAGFGLEAGVSTIIGIVDGLSAEVGTYFAWRKPVTIEGEFSVSEYAITIPALMRGTVFKSPVYWQGGLQLYVPFNTTLKDADGGKSALDEREPFDIGLMIGAGWQFRQNMSADVRAVQGMRSFDGRENRLLWSLSAGVGYQY